MKSSDFALPIGGGNSTLKLTQYLGYLGNPKTLGELVESFNKSIRENEPANILYFKLFNMMGLEELFPIIIDSVKNARDTKYIEYAFRYLNAFPEDEDVLKRYIVKILRLMQEKNDQFIIYEGVNLLYRICSVYPKIKEELSKNPIIVDKLTAEKTAYLLENPMSLTIPRDEKVKSYFIESLGEFNLFTSNFMAAE